MNHINALLPVESWAEVLRLESAGVPLYYKAPLDIRPTLVRVVRQFKNGKMRIAAPELTFTADVGHRNRFFRLAHGEAEAKRAARMLGHIALCQGRVFECFRCPARGVFSTTDADGGVTAAGPIFVDRCPNGDKP